LNLKSLCPSIFVANEVHEEPPPLQESVRLESTLSWEVGTTLGVPLKIGGAQWLAGTQHPVLNTS